MHDKESILCEEVKDLIEEIRENSRRRSRLGRRRFRRRILKKMKILTRKKINSKSVMAKDIKLYKDGIQK